MIVPYSFEGVLQFYFGVKGSRKVSQKVSLCVLRLIGGRRLEQDQMKLREWQNEHRMQAEAGAEAGAKKKKKGSKKAVEEEDQWINDGDIEREPKNQEEKVSRGRAGVVRGRDWRRDVG